MSKINFKSWLPHLVAVIIFLLITLIYFSPLLEGKRLAQHDVAQWRGMSKEIIDFRERTGDEPLWTNSMFGGMPAYQISVVYEGNLLRYVDMLFTLGLPVPANYVFLYLIGFYFLLVTLKIDPKISMAGAIAFAFSSYFFIIIDAGHNSKAHAIGYIAPVIAGVLLTFRGRWLSGGAIAALFLSLQFMTNHLQITYYMLIILVLLGIFQLVKNINENRVKEYFYSLGILFIVAIFAIATNITSLWATYEYGQYTIRGPSELTSNDQSTGGLDKDYALGWSYGVAESMTLLVPNYMGGATMGKLDEKSELYKTMISQGVAPAQARQIISQVPLYWGDQPVTSGPTYLGVISLFLFVLALFTVKGPYKWWLLSAAVLGLILSWGKNFMWFTDIFFNYVPLYNKFRAVSMTLVIVCFTVPLLAWLGLRKIEKIELDKNSLIKYLKYSVGIVGGILLLLIVFAGALDYFGPIDEQLVNQYQWQNWMLDALRTDRASLMRMDALRGLFFVLASAGAIWFYLKNKLNRTAFVTILAGLVLVDMWTVNRSY
ncbi:MAG: YfhO family protein, partial [Bacteroidia bacterium]